jgi:hypothetical protein
MTISTSHQSSLGLRRGEIIPLEACSKIEKILLSQSGGKILQRFCKPIPVGRGRVATFSQGAINMRLVFQL